MKHKNLLFILVVMIVVFGIDAIRISQYDVYPVRPEQSIQTNESQIYWELTNSTTSVDWERLDGTLEYIEGV